MAEEGFNALHSVNKMLNCILHLRKESGRHICMDVCMFY